MSETNDEYKTLAPASVAEGFYSEKRSKFLAFAHHVDSEEAAKEIVAEYRKKYYDARHVCFAYVLGNEGELFRANDDGEPSSTAGKPILGQIQKNGLTNTLVVVIRYYGGVNLGTGGLIVAYRTATADALEKAEIMTCQVEEVVDFNFSYLMMNSVMKVVKELSPRIIAQQFDNDCQISLGIRKSKAPLLREKLANLSFEQ